MPLILITGFPSSGKTHRAQQIIADFEARLDLISKTASQPYLPSNLTIQYLPSSHASHDPPNSASETIKPANPPANPRDLIYNSARDEKTARAEEFSAAKRALSKTNIVVLDAPNYIKGFRYQLWCEAKAVGTRSVVIHAAAREDECKIWNDERVRAWAWDEVLREPDGPSEIDQKKSKVGKDVQGDLQPESHTAIYGDRLAENVGTRSRSSSMGGGSYNDDDDHKTRRGPTDTMTLKSLYISNSKNNTEPTNHERNSNAPNVEPPSIHPSSTQPPGTPAPTSPPPPTSSLPYTPSTLRSLTMRYEPPSPFTRWDTPLFTIPSTDTHPPYQAIWDALFPPCALPTKKTLSQLRLGDTLPTQPKEVRRHAATVLPKASGTEALQSLESATADVVRILISTARDHNLTDGEGGSLTISIPDPKSGVSLQIEIDIPLNTLLSQPALQRLRRKYTQIQRGGIAHGQGHVSGRAEVVADFSRFLMAEWNSD